MVLRCECGGGIKCTGGTDPEQTEARGGYFETYECTVCGNTGGYEFDRATQTGTTSGCVVQANVPVERWS